MFRTVQKNILKFIKNFQVDERYLKYLEENLAVNDIKENWVRRNQKIILIKTIYIFKIQLIKIGKNIKENAEHSAHIKF